MQSVNLMPDGYIQTERSKRRLLVSIAVVIASVLAMVGLGRLLNNKINQEQQVTSILERELQEMNESRVELAASSQQLRALAAKFEVVQTLNRNRHCAAYLASVAEAAGESILLTRAHISPAEVNRDDSGHSTPPTPAGTTATDEDIDETRPEPLVLLIKGYALTNTDITRFITALSATGLFESVNFKGSEAARLHHTTLSRFELECPIRYGPAAGAPKPPASETAGPAPHTAATLAATAMGGER